MQTPLHGGGSGGKKKAIEGKSKRVNVKLTFSLNAIHLFYFLIWMFSSFHFHFKTKLLKVILICSPKTGSCKEDIGQVIKQYASFQ